MLPACSCPLAPAPEVGEMVQMMAMREFPLREGCRMRVSLESLYGTCLRP